MEQIEILSKNSTLLNITNVTLNTQNCSEGHDLYSRCASSDIIHNNVYVLKIVINFLIFPVFAITGVFGNISTIVVFSRKNAKSSSSILIIGLAVSDLLLIFIRSVHNILSIGHVFFAEAVRFARPNSFFWMYLSYIPQRTGNCLILAIVLERFTAVWFPMKFKQLWTMKSTKIFLAVTVLFNLGGLISVISILIFSLNEEIPEQGVISTDQELGRYVRFEARIVQMCSLAYKIISEILPLLLVFVFNILIIFGIRKNSMKKTEERREKEAKMTRMLLTVSVMFVLLYGPLTTTVVCTIVGLVEVSAVPIVLYETFSIMTVLNSVINFVVYGFCNKTFRKEYFKLWCCKKDNSDSV